MKINVLAETEYCGILRNIDPDTNGRKKAPLFRGGVSSVVPFRKGFPNGVNQRSTWPSVDLWRAAIRQTRRRRRTAEMSIGSCEQSQRCSVPVTGEGRIDFTFRFAVQRKQVCVCRR